MAVSPSLTAMSLEKIIFDQAKRQRAINDAAVIALMHSIETRGLLHPIILTRACELLTGGHRYIAYCRLKEKWANHNPAEDGKKNPYLRIPFRYFDDITELEKALVEFEENANRTNLTWQENAKAITLIHDLLVRENPEQTLEQTAKRLGSSLSTVSVNVRVGRALNANDDAELNSCTGIVGAKNYLDRKVDRMLDQTMSKFMSGQQPLPVPKTNLTNIMQKPISDVEEDSPQPTSTNQAQPTIKPPAIAPSQSSQLPTIIQPQTDFSIITGDFMDFIQQYSGDPFTVIHTDFPYGINFDKHDGQFKSIGKDRYSDDPEIYKTYVENLVKNIDRVLGYYGHIFHWFSMQYYQWTVEKFSTIPGIFVEPAPMIWGRNGICPAPDYGPRRGYETALFMRRNNTKILKPVNNIVVNNDPRGTDHASAKSIAILQYFFSMFMDNTSRLFDPTVGCGSSLIAAHTLGVKCGVGVEISQEFANSARTNIERFRKA